MTPNHATKGNRRYRYYVTREASAEEPTWRVSAWDMERLIDERVRTLLRDRNRITRLAVALDPRRAELVADAAHRIASAPSICAKAEALGIERVDLHEERLDITICERDLIRACGIIVPDDHPRELSIGIAVERVRRGHEIRLAIPRPNDIAQPSSRRDPKLIAIVTEAIELRDAVLSRSDKAFSGIAAELGKCRKHMAKLLPLGWLAPDIIKAIAEGSQPATLTAKQLMMIDLPVDWMEQRKVLGFA